jgi:hypothetical protein
MAASGRKKLQLEKLTEDLRRLHETLPVLIALCYGGTPDVTFGAQPSWFATQFDPLYPNPARAREQYREQCVAYIKEAEKLIGAPDLLKRVCEEQGGHFRCLGPGVGWIANLPLAVAEFLERWQGGLVRRSRPQIPLRKQPPYTPPADVKELENLFAVFHALDVEAQSLRWLDLNRPPVEAYVFQEYPRFMYNTSGATQAARDLKERQKMLAQGWSETPFPAVAPSAETPLSDRKR